MGRIKSPGKYVARPAWYDRNPVSRNGYFAGASGPHAITTRLTYTCPAGKKAILEVMQARVDREIVATTPNYAQAIFEFEPAGGTAYYLLAARILTNNVGDKERAELGGNLTMYPGDVLRGRTVDVSTGGQCAYQLSYKLTEFDA